MPVTSFGTVKPDLYAALWVQGYLQIISRGLSLTDFGTFGALRSQDLTACIDGNMMFLDTNGQRADSIPPSVGRCVCPLSLPWPSQTALHNAQISAGTSCKAAHDAQAVKRALRTPRKCTVVGW